MLEALVFVKEVETFFCLMFLLTGYHIHQFGTIKLFYKHEIFEKNTSFLN